MNSVCPRALPMLALAVAWTLASAEDTNVSVFGMPLGLPLQVSECDKKLVGGLTMYAPGAATCFERLGDQGKLHATAPIEDDTILIRFAANEAPAVMSGGVATGLVVGGKLEGLTFNTRGTDAQAQVMDALKQNFGEPTSVAPKQVQNSLGETFDTVDATWGLPQVEIFFRAVTARVDVGLLSVDTGLGRDHRRQRAPGSVPLSAQTPEPAAPAQSDLLRSKIVVALAEQRHDAVLEGMTTYRTLESEGVAIPVSLFFAESEAALALRDWLRAYTALGDYLARAVATDPLYSDALRRFTGVETKALEVAEGRDREMQLAAAAELKAIDEQKKADVARFVDELFADLVVVPAGKFRMGDVSGKGEADERPLRNVSIAAFRLGRNEVTFAQFDRFCAATGRKPPDDNGWGREQRPVINVSWDDAIAFITWLNEQSGHAFRLPSEAEWEYAARGGRVSDYWWGAEFSPEHANAKSTGGRDQWPGTAPVGQFPANPFGLSDMNGNVREWVQDCWHPDYSGAPVDGQPWLTGECSRRVVRGGAWNLGGASLRSSDREWDDRNFGFTDRGFRVATSE